MNPSLGAILTHSNAVTLTQPGLSESELLLAVSRAARLLMNHPDWRDAMPDFLAELGRHTGSNRVWMFQVLEQAETYYVTDYIHEWVSDPRWSNIADPDLHQKVWDLTQTGMWELYQARCRGEMLQHHVDENKGSFQSILAAQGIRSMLTIPIIVDNQWWGILGFDDNETPKEYTPAHLAALETGAILVTNVILRERMRWEADHDYLTSLYNRRYLVRLMDQAIIDGQDGGFIMLDADWLKQINDEHGHQAGDQALVHITYLMRQSVPSEACCARFGGEEFAIWVPDLKGSDHIKTMQAIAKGLRQTVVDNPLEWDGRTIRISMSLGVACSHNLRSFEALISLADQALFDAKAQGRNCVVVRT